MVLSVSEVVTNAGEFVCILQGIWLEQVYCEIASPYTNLAGGTNIWADLSGISGTWTDESAGVSNLWGNEIGAERIVLASGLEVLASGSLVLAGLNNTWIDLAP